MTLEGKTTLITGATAGIGKAAAEYFASKGSHVCLLARDNERLEQIKAELTARYPNVLVTPIAHDVQDVEGLLKRLHDLCEETPIDVAIINAAIGLYGPFEMTDWQDVNSVLRTNIDGALGTARALLPQMTQRGSGSIIFVSSVVGIRAIPYNAVYCASKFALRGFADGLRLEVQRKGIHVGIVNPSRTATEFSQRMKYILPQKLSPFQVTSPPELVAKTIYRAVIHKRREVVASLSGKLLAFAGRHFPRTLDTVFSLVVPHPTYEPDKH